MPPLSTAVVALLLAAPPAPDPELARGLALVRARDYPRAEETLQAVVRRVYGRPAAGPTLVQAYVGLGVASVGQDRRDGARDWFAEALAVDPKLRPGSDQPPEAVRLFEEVRAVRVRSAAPERQAARRKRTLVALGAAAAAGGAAAGVVALAPEAPVEVITNARMGTSAITCPNPGVASEVPFTVLVDATPREGSLEVRAASVALAAVDALFLRPGSLQIPRPTAATPSRIGPGPGTIVLQATFPCSGFRSGAPRVDTWQAVVTLGTSAGSFYIQARGVLAVSYP